MLVVACLELLAVSVLTIYVTQQVTSPRFWISMPLIWSSSLSLWKRGDTSVCWSLEIYFSSLVGTSTALSPKHPHGHFSLLTEYLYVFVSGLSSAQLCGSITPSPCSLGWVLMYSGAIYLWTGMTERIHMGTKTQWLPLEPSKLWRGLCTCWMTCRQITGTSTAVGWSSTFRSGRTVTVSQKQICRKILMPSVVWTWINVKNGNELIRVCEFCSWTWGMKATKYRSHCLAFRFYKDEEESNCFIVQKSTPLRLEEVTVFLSTSMFKDLHGSGQWTRNLKYNFICESVRVVRGKHTCSEASVSFYFCLHTLGTQQHSWFLSPTKFHLLKWDRKDFWYFIMLIFLLTAFKMRSFRCFSCCPTPPANCLQMCNNIGPFLISNILDREQSSPNSDI